MSTKGYMQIGVLIIVGGHGPCISASGNEQDEDIIRGIYSSDREMVMLATGYKQPLSLAPAIATVITAEDIETIGAITIEDLLETVPGIHVSTSRGLSPNFFIRGFFQELNAQVLILVNGIQVNDIVNAGRPQAWTMPVQNIERIEIIRGPGSAVYGADAFAGTINITTKTARDIDGVEIGSFGGDFDTVGGWGQYGASWGDVDVSASIETRTTDGHQRTLQADVQTRLDGIFGTSASLAPGQMNTEREDINARLELALDDSLRFRAGYQGFLDVGTGVGTAEALDPKGELDVQLINADLTYRPMISKQWDVESQVSFLTTDTDTTLVLLPAGAFAGSFPDGVRNDLAFRVDQIRIGASGNYRGFQHHRLRVGGGFTYAKVSNIDDRRNFFVGPSGIPIPTGTFADTDTLGVPAVFDKQNRKIWYGFVQDEWQIAPDWTLTAGVRVDEYNDFGTTVNPRASLVWSATNSLTLKGLYGRAFRPPSIAEQSSNLPLIALGNPNINAETIDWLDFQAIQRWNKDWTTSLNVYYFDADKLIAVDRSTPPTPANPVSFANNAGRDGYGLEFETEYALTNYIGFALNYAYYHGEDKDTNEPSGVAPTHQIYSAMDWEILPEWRLNTRVNWVAGRDRRHSDTRRDISDYVVVGLTLRHILAKRWDFSLTVNNLFDEKAREPSAVNPGALPEDIPISDRSLIGQVKLQF